MSLPSYIAVFFDLGMTLVESDTTKWNPGAPDVLTELRAQGLRLGVISNTGDLTRDQLKSRLPSDLDWNIFEPGLVILSSEVKIEKPALKIFHLAVSRAGVPAGRCLYCSEDLEETLAAQHAGMLAARIHPPPKSDLQSLSEVLRRIIR